MARQSSRAEITPWAFDNEYHYGDFRGDAAEILRRGYDFHLHYANFGVRPLMIRLPGRPAGRKGRQALFRRGGPVLREGQTRAGRQSSPGTLLRGGGTRRVMGRGKLHRAALAVAGRVLDGDLRPLYLARLALGGDMNHDPEEMREGPVPAGLNQLTKAQQALAEFHGLGEALIAAAARESPPLPTSTGAGNPYLAWIERQPAAIKDAWLAEWLADPRSAVRREILAEYQRSQGSPSWPTVRADRTIAELKAAAEEIARDLTRKKADKAARERAKKLADMAADADPTLRETEELTKQRTQRAYAQVAELLADLREALAGTDRVGLAEDQARKLKEANPKLHMLTSALRGKGFVKK